MAQPVAHASYPTVYHPQFDIPPSRPPSRWPADRQFPSPPSDFRSHSLSPPGAWTSPDRPRGDGRSHSRDGRDEREERTGYSGAERVGYGSGDRDEYERIGRGGYGRGGYDRGGERRSSGGGGTGQSSDRDGDKLQAAIKATILTEKPNVRWDECVRRSA